ncbi:MAG: octaprenyl diphosphate synthase [Gammaproteobacteria bacterium]|nr:octaprenyl diphosphate synthase [Gammaproteobacteria bacterium]
MDIQETQALVSNDMRAVDSLIRERLQSDVVLVNQLGNYIINSGGKRLRPLLVLLGARANGYSGVHHITLAAVIEFIHTATLLHDDVVDASELRRGHDTANAIWGNEASVLVGDFLYSRAFQMMVDVGNIQIMDIMADTTNTIAEGEVQQLLNCNDPDTTEETYLQVIRSKTAKLFEAATHLGAILAGRDEREQKAMAAFGIHLGTAFQLIDDILDYQSSSKVTGKNVGDDLAEGKPTLPLIYAMQHGTKEQTRITRDAIRHGGRSNIDKVIETIESTGAITYTSRSARDEADMAIAAIADIPDNRYKDALKSLAEFSVNRNY